MADLAAVIEAVSGSGADGSGAAAGTFVLSPCRSSCWVGANSPDWFHRTVEATTDAIPGARLVMLDGQDHGAPPEVIAPVLTEFFLGSLDRPGPRVLAALRG